MSHAEFTEEDLPEESDRTFVRRIRGTYGDQMAYATLLAMLGSAVSERHAIHQKVREMAHLIKQRVLTGHPPDEYDRGYMYALMTIGATILDRDHDEEFVEMARLYREEASFFARRSD